MIVNDSKAIHIYLKQTINTFDDCEIVNSSYNGRMALIALQYKRPDVIILDLEMPQIDGLTFLEKINGLYNTPVIIMSTYAKNGSAILEDALNSGAVDYISPPSENSSSEAERFKTILHSKIVKSQIATMIKS